MKNKIYFFFLLICSNYLSACSAFFSDGQTKYLAKNFDWSTGQGYIIKNNKDIQKFTYGLRGSKQATWISKYGSITFNQIGKEFPYGGINEKGLVVEQLWMSESYYQNNNNQTISELEWIQYQLDNYSTIDEIICNIDNLTIEPITTIHYFIADKNGNSAVIDFVEGKTIINKKHTSVQVITNETFLKSESYFKKNNGTIDIKSRSNFDRYCQIKNSLSVFQIDNQNQAFDILENSSENSANYKTYWTIVYDLTNLKIYCKSFDSKEIKQIDLLNFKFEKDSELLASNINASVLNFEKYTFEINEKLFNNAIKLFNLKLDEKLATEHQMNPNKNVIDLIYQNNYIDLKIIFLTKTKTGNISYTLLNGDENFKKRKGIKSTVFSVNKIVTKKIIYAMPKGEYALASYQDTNFDNQLDKNLFGIPKNFGFSRNKRSFLGTPPKYDEAKLDFQNNTEIIINIR